ncbi:60S ribosomal protein L36a [Hordeum vulgare]|nr:60S ribosomal protein L36a [Hordeum vulgare]
MHPRTIQAYEHQVRLQALHIASLLQRVMRNEKWIQRIAETTPKISRLSISVEEDAEVDEDANNRPEGNKIAKERKKRNAFSGTYKEELVAMIERKKVLATGRKEEKMTRWNELRMLEDEKWKAKLADEERK